MDKSTKDISQIQDLIIRNDETLRIVDHYFKDYKHNHKVRDSPAFDRFDKLDYLTVSEEDEYEDFTPTPIEEGEVLTKQTFMGINQKEVDIFGDGVKSSLIMFSFIGCSASEIAI